MTWAFMSAEEHPGLSGDDILRASAGRQLRAAEGFTYPGIGTVLYRGGAAPQRRMVDEHERLHVELNGACSFGLLLSMVGRNLVQVGESERKALLRQLIDLCRTTHEVYATTISVWAMDDGDRATALDDYPGYEKYFEIGEKFASGFPTDSMVAQALVVGACISAMQVPLHLLVEGREDWATQPLDAGPSHSPDQRLTAVLEVLEGHELDFSWIRRDVDPRWTMNSAPDIYGSPDHKRDYHTILIRVYHQYGWALSQRGIPVLAWDTHLRYRDIPVYSSLEPGTFPAQHLGTSEVEDLEAATAASSNRLHVIASSEGQSVHRAAFQAPLSIGHLGSILQPTTTELDFRTFVYRSPAGLQLIVRPTEAVIASHAVSEEQAGLLRAVSHDGVLTAVRTSIDGPKGPQTVLGLMTSPADLELLMLAAMMDASIPPWFYSSISMSCLFSKGWSQTWLTGIRHVTFPVLLVDLPPSTFIMGQRDPDGFIFAEINFENPPDLEESTVDPIRGVLIRRNRAEMTIEEHLAVMGSSVLIDNFTARLAELPKAVPGADELKGSMAAGTMLNLATEEPQFHFNGYEYLPELFPPEEPKLNPGEIERWMTLRALLGTYQKKWHAILKRARESPSD